MTTYYVRSTDGVNTDDGLSWANAWATLKYALETAPAGSTIYVSQAHSETNIGGGTNASITPLGTRASPQYVYCVNDSTGALATGAVWGTSASDDFLLAGGYVFFSGIEFRAGTSTGTAPIFLGSGSPESLLVFRGCKFVTNGGASTWIYIGPTSGAGVNNNVIRFENCTVKFGNASSGFAVRSFFEWEGGGLDSTSSAITTLFKGYDRAGSLGIALRGVDLSYAATGLVISAIGTSGARPPKDILLANCKMPSGWNGTPWASSNTNPGCRVRLHNCDSSDTNFLLYEDGGDGSTVSSTAIYRSGGAGASGLYNGATQQSGYSWVMSTTADAEYPLIVLRSPEIVQWNDTTGSSKTVTVEFVHDTNSAAGQGAGTSYAFQDDEVWLEVIYLGTSGVPLGVFNSDAKGTSGGTTVDDPIATAADQDSSSETWTTTGMTTPVKQKLSVTFTPQEKGFIHARVCLAKASKVIYVDPLITVT